MIILAGVDDELMPGILMLGGDWAMNEEADGVTWMTGDDRKQRGHSEVFYRILKVTGTIIGKI
jgi:hypothetical protein